MDPQEYEDVIEVDGTTNLYKTNIKMPGNNFEVIFKFEFNKNFIDVAFPDKPFCITWKTENDTKTATILKHKHWFYEQELNDEVDKVVGKNKLKFQYEYNQITVTCLDPEIKSLCLGNVGLQWASLRSPLDFTKQSTYTFQIEEMNNSIDIQTNFTGKNKISCGCYSTSDFPKIRCCNSDEVNVVSSNNYNLEFYMFPRNCIYPFKYKGLLKVKLLCVPIYNDRHSV